MEDFIKMGFQIPFSYMLVKHEIYVLKISWNIDPLMRFSGVNYQNKENKEIRAYDQKRI